VESSGFSVKRGRELRSLFEFRPLRCEAVRTGIQGIWQLGMRPDEALASDITGTSHACR
jgi:hypothetical protein